MFASFSLKISLFIWYMILCDLLVLSVCGEFTTGSGKIYMQQKNYDKNWKNITKNIHFSIIKFLRDFYRYYPFRAWYHSELMSVVKISPAVLDKQHN